MCLVLGSASRPVPVSAALNGLPVWPFVDINLVVPPPPKKKCTPGAMAEITGDIKDLRQQSCQAFIEPTSYCSDKSCSGGDLLCSAMLLCAILYHTVLFSAVDIYPCSLVPSVPLQNCSTEPILSCIFGGKTFLEACI